MANQPPRLGDAAHLPPMIDLATAAQYLGIGRTTAYALAAKDALPVPVVRIGSALRVPTAPLLKILGITVPERDMRAIPDDDRTVPDASGGTAGTAGTAVSGVSGRRGREDPPRPPLRRARKWSVDRPRAS